MTIACLAGPKKAKSSPTSPPGSGDQLHQQNSMPSKSAANVSRHNLRNPSAVEKQDPTAADKQLLPATGTHDQEPQGTLLNADANTQLSTAAVPSNQSSKRVMDSSLHGNKHVADSQSSSSEKMTLDLASTSESPESRTQRLKKRVLSGSHATTSTQSSAARIQPHRGSSTYSPGSRPPLHLSSDLDKLGTLSQQLPCL